MTTNRHQQRAQAAQDRKNPSVALIRKQLVETEAMLEQARLILLAVVKSQGRIRVPHAIVAGVQPGEDSIVASDAGEDLVLTFVESTRVIPRGHSAGKGNEAS